MKINYSIIPKQECPHCGDGSDKPAVIQLPILMGRKPKPKPRDVAVCASCAKVGVFDNDLILRMPTNEERYRILRNQLILDTQMALAYGWR